MLIVGNLTVDVVDKKKTLVSRQTDNMDQKLLAWFSTHGHVYDLQGGAISYAAAVATAFGIKACIVTAAGSDANLTVFEGHELHVVSTQETLTFEHSYTWWGESHFQLPPVTLLTPPEAI